MISIVEILCLEFLSKVYVCCPAIGRFFNICSYTFMAIVRYIFGVFQKRSKFLKVPRIVVVIPTLKKPL